MQRAAARLRTREELRKSGPLRIHRPGLGMDTASHGRVRRPASAEQSAASCEEEHQFAADTVSAGQPAGTVPSRDRAAKAVEMPCRAQRPRKRPAAEAAMFNDNDDDSDVDPGDSDEQGLQQPAKAARNGRQGGPVTHRSVEKRRRDRINNLIEKLAECVPPCSSKYLTSKDARGVRRPKHTVLSDTLALLGKLRKALTSSEQHIAQLRDGTQEALASAPGPSADLISPDGAQVVEWEQPHSRQQPQLPKSRQRPTKGGKPKGGKPSAGSATPCLAMQLPAHAQQQTVQAGKEAASPASTSTPSAVHWQGLASQASGQDMGGAGGPMPSCRSQPGDHQNMAMFWPMYVDTVKQEPLQAETGFLPLQGTQHQHQWGVVSAAPGSYAEVKAEQQGAGVLRSDDEEDSDGSLAAAAAVFLGPLSPARDGPDALALLSRDMHSLAPHGMAVGAMGGACPGIPQGALRVQEGLASCGPLINPMGSAQAWPDLWGYVPPAANYVCSGNAMVVGGGNFMGMA